jgi:hypothetical protein
VETSHPGPTEFHSAQALGTVTGLAGAPSASVVRVGVAPYRDWSVAVDAADDGSFDAGVIWRAPPGESSVTLALHAWESDDARPPGHYYGFGRSSSMSFADRAVISGLALALEPVEEGTVEADISLPAGFDDPDLLAQLWLDFGPYEQLSLFSELIAPDSFSLVVPSLPDVESWMGVSTGNGWHRRRVTPPFGEVAFAPPAPPELDEPAADADMVQDALFRWNEVAPGGSSRLFVECSGPDQEFGNTFFVDAEGTEATLPAIPDVEVDANATCRWGVLWCAGTDRASEVRCAWSAERAIAP